MNKQRKVLITITYNELGIITDTKAEEVPQPNLQPACNQLATDTNVGDTISRQAALDIFDDYNVSVENGELEAYSRDRKRLCELPHIQPEPKEGHWIRTDCGLDVECKCSVCGYKDFVEPHDTYWFKRNYCPNCGAKMKGAKHETN